MATARTSGRCRRRTQGVVPHPKTRRIDHVHTSLQGFPQLCPDKHSDFPGPGFRAVDDGISVSTTVNHSGTSLLTELATGQFEKNG